MTLINTFFLNPIRYLLKVILKVNSSASISTLNNSEINLFTNRIEILET